MSSSNDLLSKGAACPVSPLGSRRHMRVSPYSIGVMTWARQTGKAKSTIDFSAKHAKVEALITLRDSCPDQESIGLQGSGASKGDGPFDVNNNNAKPKREWKPKKNPKANNRAQKNSTLVNDDVKKMNDQVESLKIALRDKCKELQDLTDAQSEEAKAQRDAEAAAKKLAEAEAQEEYRTSVEDRFAGMRIRYGKLKRPGWKTYVASMCVPMLFYLVAWIFQLALITYACVYDDGYCLTFKGAFQLFVGECLVRWYGGRYWWAGIILLYTCARIFIAWWYQYEHNYVFKCLFERDAPVPARSDSMSQGELKHMKIYSAIFLYSHVTFESFLFGLLSGGLVVKTREQEVSLELFSQLTNPRTMPLNAENDKGVFDSLNYAARSMHSVNIDRYAAVAGLHYYQGSVVLAYAHFREMMEQMSELDFPMSPAMRALC